ncbi:MAG TPA: patatin-like phospholipase family protein [Kribbella sp.]|nr:patatin-like phospholipase family protein [Kribbella sp.]
MNAADVPERPRESRVEPRLLAESARLLFSGLPLAAESELDLVAQLRAREPMVTELLQSHSVLTTGDTSWTAAELFIADDGDRMTPEWSELQSRYVAKALVLATVVLLADVRLAGMEPDVAIRVGFGLDTENVLLRDRLFGPFGRQVDLALFEGLPHRVIRFDEVFRLTCLGGLRHALGEFGRAADGVPREWTTAVINSIAPRRGCAGDWLEIKGRRFGQPQPAGVTLTFTAYAGGWVSAPVDPADWQDTVIRVRAPTGVGVGPVGFLRETGATGSGQTVASAAEQVAGEALACLGLAAIGFSQKLRDLGPRLDAPHITSTQNNRFVGGPPKIRSFLGNGAARVMLRPRGTLRLSWLTDNADKVEIIANGPPELPQLPTSLPVTGEHLFSPVNTTTSWTGSYILTARNRCGSVSRTLDVEMRERKALVLAGGGSKGAFEVGAVRCLYDVFGYRPDLLCGASVGALNAAKLAEGPAALSALENLWLAMKDSSDLYTPTPTVTRLINNLASLGVKYLSGIDLADLLGVRLGNQSWLSPDAEIAVGVAKNVLGSASGAGTLFTVTDLIFAAARAGLLIGKVVTDLEKLVGSPSIFFADPVRAKIDASIDPAKISSSGVELRVVTVNLDDGRARYVDQRGRFIDDDTAVNLRAALQASASIPIAYPPTVLPGGNYVDGGVRDNAPLAAADIAGASDVVAVLPSPERMAPHNYTGAAFPTIAARSFEALFDETWQNDLSPFRGYNVPVRVIAPQIETHSLLKVDAGLVRIDMDYGYMRAYDEFQSNVGERAALRGLSLQIASKRLEVWAEYEHRSEGVLQDEERGRLGSVGLTHVPSADSLADVRRLKLEIRAHCLERQTRVKDARANPSGIEAAWQTWEKHKWSPTIATPWEATYAHVGPPLPKVAVPPPLPPP